MYRILCLTYGLLFALKVYMVNNVNFLIAFCLLACSCRPASIPIPDRASGDRAAGASRDHPTLEQVYADSLYELTGVAVAKDGRLFTNYPLWPGAYKYAVAEIKDGRAVPYPNAEMNACKMRRL